MSKLVKLSMIGATGAVLCFAGGSAALAGPVGLADAAAVAPPAATESVHYRRAEGRSAHYCPPRRVEHRTVYVRKIIERRTAYVQPRYIIERRTAYVAAPVATAVAVPVVAATYPGYGGYGGGYGAGPGIIGAGAGLLGGVLNIGFGGGGWGGGGWGGPGWGGGWGWRGRRGWW